VVAMDESGRKGGTRDVQLQLELLP